METKTAFVFTISEAEEILQTALDNADLKLRPADNFVYPFAYAVTYPQLSSDTQNLDAGEIDQRMATYLNVPQCETWLVDEKMIVLVDQNDV